jgi:hypothetical protein
VPQYEPPAASAGCVEGRAAQVQEAQGQVQAEEDEAEAEGGVNILAEEDEAALMQEGVELLAVLFHVTCQRAELRMRGRIHNMGAILGTQNS